MMEYVCPKNPDHVEHLTFTSETGLRRTYCARCLFALLDPVVPQMQERKEPDAKSDEAEAVVQEGGKPNLSIAGRECGDSASADYESESHPADEEAQGE